jgi:putative ABC transport system permease protein
VTSTLLQRFIQIRVAERHQRPLRQLREEHPHPPSADRQRRREIGPVDEQAALVLAAVGLYAVTAYSVAQRTREIGVRVALGAQARHVWWLVTRSASWQIAAGLAVGIAGSVSVSRAVPVAITRVEGTDPITLGSAIALLVGVALAACLIPSRRAMRLNPVDALRSE